MVYTTSGMVASAKPLWKCFGISVTNLKRKRYNSMTTYPTLKDHNGNLIVCVPAKRPSRAQEYAVHKKVTKHQCHCCGKPISDKSLKTAMMVHMTVNQEIMPADAVLAEESDSWDQGWFYIGTACAKRHYPAGYYTVRVGK